MKGLELSRKYFEAFGIPMIREQFPEYEEMIAAGLTGSGSECYGYDDELSADHDFEPGFCLFIPGEEIVDRKTAFRMERAYAKLPAEFEGYTRKKISPVGGSRHGVFRMEEYFRERIGCLPENLTPDRWVRIPESVLAEAVNGEMFQDRLSLMEDQRELLRRPPEDVLRKKLAGHLLMMAQSGQYNYPRCIRRDETGGAQLAVFEFVRHAMAALFLLQGKYMPYYKWSFRAFRELPGHADDAAMMEAMISSDNGPERAEAKYDQIEGLASRIIDLLQERRLTEAVCGDLEKHAYSVNDGIADGWIRNLPMME